MNSRALIEQFIDEAGLIACRDEPLCRHCTWEIGGPADYLVEPATLEHVTRAVTFAREHRIPLIVIGKGSNLLFDDAGLRGIALKIDRRLSELAVDGNKAVAQSGISASRLARAVGVRGLSGLEHTVGIPGNLGGLIAMNGGSQRKSIGDVITWVKAIDENGDLQTFSHEACKFSYRQSVFLGAKAIIVEAGIQLERGDPRETRKEMLGILRSRRRKFPRREPNCGSVFKSTVEMFNTVGPPGKLIEEAGLKGLQVGAAVVSTQHANFIINTGGAASRDIIELIGRIRAAVHRRTGVSIASEVQHVAPTGEILSL